MAAKRRSSRGAPSAARNGNRNGHKPSANGRKKTPAATLPAFFNRRDRAVELWLSGKSIGEIAADLAVDERSVYRYIQSARARLIAENAQHFNERLALMLDSVFDQIECAAQRLSDPDFLKTENPGRLDAIYRGIGILSDKCFVLLSLAGRARGAQPGELPSQQGAGEAEPDDDDHESAG